MPQATPPFPPESFCKRVGPNLFIRVLNQGDGPAGPSLTAVQFEDLGKFSVPTMPLAPGESTELTFQIPQGCFGPGAGEVCSFMISVDDGAAVEPEISESNNMAEGSCVVVL